MFLRSAQQVLLPTWLVSYSGFLFGNNKQTVLKRKDDHIPLVIDFIKKIVIVCGTLNLSTVERKQIAQMHSRKLYRS